MSVFNIRQVVNEVYFGRTSGINALIAQLGKYRRACGVEDAAAAEIAKGKGEKYIRPRASLNNQSKELTEFNRMMENEFGFKTFALTTAANSDPNLYTYSISLNFDVIGSHMKDNLAISKQGFKYLQKAKYSCLVVATSAVILDEHITDEELMALILHEVGHNFTGALSGQTMTLIGVRKFLYAFEIFIDILRGQANIAGSVKAVFQNTNHYKTLRNKFFAALETNGFGRIFKFSIELINNVFEAISDLVGQVSYALMTLFLYSPLVQIISMLSQVPRGLDTILGGVRDEQIADSFAGMYGLGPQLASGLDKIMYGRHKMTSVKTILNDTPLIGQMTDIIWFPTNMVAGVFDSHPSNAERYRNQMELLKRELQNQNVDPKMRKEIESELKMLEESFDRTYNDLNANEDPHYYIKAYQKFLYDNCDFGGGKSQFFTPSDNFDDIDYAAKNAVKLDKHGGVIGKGLAQVKFK